MENRKYAVTLFSSMKLRVKTEDDCVSKSNEDGTQAQYTPFIGIFVQSGQHHQHWVYKQGSSDFLQSLLSSVRGNTYRLKIVRVNMNGKVKRTAGP